MKKHFAKFLLYMYRAKLCVLSVNCPEGDGYVLLSNRSEHGRLEAVFGAD